MRKLTLILCGIFFLSVCFPQEEDLKKKVLMIIAEENFRDEELFITKDLLEKNGVIIEVASKTKRLCRGMLGGTIQASLSLEEINPKNYSAVIFVGGIGASQYFNDEVALRIAKEFYLNNRLVCAICIAPVILAEAGILKGKRATVWSSEKDKLIKKGAIYTVKPVEKDGNIITSSGPSHSQQFAEEILNSLK